MGTCPKLPELYTAASWSPQFGLGGVSQSRARLGPRRKSLRSQAGRAPTFPPLGPQPRHRDPRSPGRGVGGEARSVHPAPRALTCVHGAGRRPGKQGGAATCAQRLPPPSGPAPLSQPARVSWCRQLGRLIIDRLGYPRCVNRWLPRALARGPNLRAPHPPAPQRGEGHSGVGRGGRRAAAGQSWERAGLSLQMCTEPGRPV